jgi:DNA-binding transcriptional ArsR family regulator
MRRVRERRGEGPVAAKRTTRARRRRGGEHDHDARITLIRRRALAADEVRALADVFRALGDPTRVRILHAVSDGEACVFDLARGLEMSPSAISHQLRVLRSLRLVRNRRAGREVYYAVDDRHVLSVVGAVLEHLRHGG